LYVCIRNFSHISCDFSTIIKMLCSCYNGFMYGKLCSESCCKFLLFLTYPLKFFLKACRECFQTNEWNSGNTSRTHKFYCIIYMHSIIPIACRIYMDFSCWKLKLWKKIIMIFPLMCISWFNYTLLFPSCMLMSIQLHRLINFYHCV